MTKAPFYWKEPFPDRSINLSAGSTLSSVYVRIKLTRWRGLVYSGVASVTEVNAKICFYELSR